MRSIAELYICFCCILNGQIKKNTVPISAIWHRSDGELCHYNRYWHILSGQIKGNTVPISAIWHRSDGELCHYIDTGTVWLKLPKAHRPPSNLKRPFQCNTVAVVGRKRFSCGWCIPQRPQVIAN